MNKQIIKKKIWDTSFKFGGVFTDVDSNDLVDLSLPLTVLDTSIDSGNLGDNIIMSFADEVINELFPCKEIVRLRTHSYDFSLEFAKKKSLKIVCGTNILTPDFLYNHPLALPIFRLKSYRHSLCLLAVGMRSDDMYVKDFTEESATLLRYILNPNVIHSVRDNATKQKLAKIGIKNVVNTSCVTMWKLDKKLCQKIPKRKAKNVLTTLTDYSKNPELDKFMIQKLIDAYENVYFWVQALPDAEYLKQLGDFCSKIKFIDNSKDALDKFYMSNDAIDCDYFGTRLHAGIYSLNHHMRSIIVNIDNRANDIANDTNLPVVRRDCLPDCIDSLIYDSRDTNISIDQNAINRWKSQFN